MLKERPMPLPSDVICTHDEFERRFVEYVVENYCPEQRANREVYALFCAVQHMFTASGNGKGVRVTSYFLSNLAGCGWIALDNDRTPSIPFANDNDNILGRAYRGLIATIVGAIRRGETIMRHEKTLVGHLTIPDWFVENAKTKWTWAPGGDE